MKISRKKNHLRLDWKNHSLQLNYEKYILLQDQVTSFTIFLFVPNKGSKWNIKTCYGALEDTFRAKYTRYVLTRNSHRNQCRHFQWKPSKMLSASVVLSSDCLKEREKQIRVMFLCVSSEDIMQVLLFNSPTENIPKSVATHTPLFKTLPSN